jgi:hypothetical protein
LVACCQSDHYFLLLTFFCAACNLVNANWFISIQSAATWLYLVAKDAALEKWAAVEHKNITRGIKTGGDK